MDDEEVINTSVSLYPRRYVLAKPNACQFL